MKLILKKISIFGFHPLEEIGRRMNVENMCVPRGIILKGRKFVFSRAERCLSFL